MMQGGGRVVALAGGMPGRLVKNAPYSADVVTESTQVLPDGNRIRQTNTMRVFRDSEGRVRREQSLRTLNGLAPNANLPEVVFISDPVAGVNYALNPSEKTAAKTSWARSRQDGLAGSNMRKGPGLETRSNAAGEDRLMPRRQNPNLKTESLGRQSIEGVPADGTRTTMTIPAGEIGNDQPILVVTETWYSSELQTEVLYKRSDPRTGETVRKMTNVSRAEPSRILFEVPADFKVSEGGGGGGRMGRGPGAPNR
jgi:hypothetical protein